MAHEQHPVPLKSLWHRWPDGCLPVLGVVRRLACVVVALQLPSWLLQSLNPSASSDEHPLFNLDLFLAAIVACFSSVAGAMLVVGAWAADLMRAVAKNYHFLSVVDLLDATRFADLLSLRLFVTLPAVLCVLLLVVCATVVLRQTRGQYRFALALLGAAFLLQAVDVANGTFGLFGLSKDERRLDINVAGSPTWNIIHDQRRSPLAKGELQPLRGAESHEALRRWLTAHPDRSSLLVLVESMGLPRDPGLRDWLMGRLATPAIGARWNVHLKSEPFVGATTSGELRTLCGLQGHYSRLTDAAARDCLPAQAKAAGLDAVGLHGFHLRMFDRREWWPRIGLTVWDGKTYDGETPHMDCNEAFRGICDGTLLREAVHRAGNPRRFVYALTLDTHLPLADGRPLPPELGGLCSRSGTSLIACEMVGRLGEVLGALESELARGGGAPAMVVVAGDHAPPFAEPRNRGAFDETRVPVLILEPIR